MNPRKSNLPKPDPQRREPDSLEPASSESNSHILVRPSENLKGEIEISGAKNSALKLMVATTLAAGEFTLKRVPHIRDVETMADLLRSMGIHIEWVKKNELKIITPKEINPVASYELVEKTRASVLVLAPLLVRCKSAEVALPGGDNLGPRPIDMHLDIIKKLGAEIEVNHGNIKASAENLAGAQLALHIPSVGATETAMMAGAGASGKTVIENAAREPEIADLASFLNRMGVPVLGAGTSTITIEGQSQIHPANHTVIPDRIEAATFLSALAIAGGEILLNGAQYENMSVLCQKFGDMGVRISSDARGIWAMACGRLKPVDVSSLPYPGVPTDSLPLLAAALCLADGVSIITENLFDSRFGYMGELARMGADVRTEGQHAIIRGKEHLSGSPVKALDIRAGAALVCAGLKAHGQTEIMETHHIDRGYENLVGKLQNLGADIQRVNA